ncbi:MAG: peptidylprolyl isomerase [Cyclobacteriaceae bacterium]
MRKIELLLIVFSISSILVTGCAQKTDHLLTIKTKYGDMVAVLYDETPKHKANFIKLAKEHYFDSLLFHRVIQGFMIQGGDPESKKSPAGKRLGNGGPGYTIDAEFNPKLFHEKGSLSAARLSDQMNPQKASSGSQFYIVQGKKHTDSEIKLDQQKFGMALQQFFQKPENKTYYDSISRFYQTRDEKGYELYILALKPIVESQLGISVEREVSPEKIKAYTTVGGTPILDGEYTVFGKVIKGLDIIDKIAGEAKNQDDRPEQDILMQVTVEEMPRRKIEKNYGYTYPETK